MLFLGKFCPDHGGDTAFLTMVVSKALSWLGQRRRLDIPRRDRAVAAFPAQISGSNNRTIAGGQVGERRGSANPRGSKEQSSCETSLMWEKVQEEGQEWHLLVTATP